MFEPLWSTSLIEREPVTLASDGNKLVGVLMFEPEEILRVEVCQESGPTREVLCSLEATGRRRDGYEFEVASSTDPGTLQPVVLPHFCADELLTRRGHFRSNQGEMFLLVSDEGPFHTRRIFVTYRHDHEWDGFVPTPKKPLGVQWPANVFFYGDSITEGRGSSLSMGLPPFTGGFAEQVGRALGDKVDTLVSAHAGKTSAEGLALLPSVLAENARFGYDLNVLAWGTNDRVTLVDPNEYASNVAKQCDLIRGVNPQAKFIVVTPCPRISLTYGDPLLLLREYEDRLTRYARLWRDVQVAPLFSYWQYVAKRKGPYDLYGNGYNHPGDFGHRLYTESILNMLMDKQ